MAGNLGDCRSRRTACAVTGQVLLLQQRQLDDALAPVSTDEDRALKDALRAARRTRRRDRRARPGDRRRQNDGTRRTGRCSPNSAARCAPRARCCAPMSASAASSTPWPAASARPSTTCSAKSTRCAASSAACGCSASTPRRAATSRTWPTGGFDVIAQQLRDITLRLVGCANAAVGGLERAADARRPPLSKAPRPAGADRVGEMEAQAVQAITLLEGVEGAARGRARRRWIRQRTAGGARPEHGGGHGVRRLARRSSRLMARRRGRSSPRCLLSQLAASDAGGYGDRLRPPQRSWPPCAYGLHHGNRAPGPRCTLCRAPRCRTTGADRLAIDRSAERRTMAAVLQ